MSFFIGNVRVMVIAIVFIVTAIPESASSDLTITVEHKKGGKNDVAIAELSKTEQPTSPEGPTTLESKNGEPTTPESTEGAAETTTEGSAETTAEGTQEAATLGTEAITSEGPIKLTTICWGCAFKEFGRKQPTTTPVPTTPTQEPETGKQPTTTPVPTTPTQEPETELPPTTPPVPEIPTQEPAPVPTQEPATVPTQEAVTVPTQEAVTVPTQEPTTVPTQEPATELPPTPPVPEIPTQEAVTEETEASIPTTESPFPPNVPVTEEDECSMFGKENKEPPEHCFKRTPRPPPTMKPLPPPEASEKPDVGLTVPPVVSPNGYTGGEITPPPTHCPPNEVYRECDFLCQPSCKRLVRPKKCPYICIPRCLCKKPLVRRESDGKCVHRSMCPKCKKPKKKCDGYPYDRIIFKPPTDNRRPPTDHRPPRYPPIDQRPPRYPPIDQRPPIYPPIDHRPPRYPPIDQRPPRYPPIDQRPPRYPPIDQEPPNGQFGLSIDYEGPSIEEFYPKRPPTHPGWKKCPPQEVFSMCAGACQATCRQPRRKCARGCICRKPFVRREADGKCVPRSKCHCKKRKCKSN